MAYYNSSYYQSTHDHGEYYHQTSYNGDISSDSLESVANSSYKDPSIYNLFDYDPTPFHHAYNHYSYDHQHVPSWSTTCYSTFTPAESKSIIIHYPNSHHVISYDQNPHPRSAISYSVSGFNVPEFDEYDPTPYGGGYDIAQTYGKPLPPSDQICYPRSTAGITAVPSLDDKPQEKEKEIEKAHDQAEKPEEKGKPKAEAEKEKSKGDGDENGTNYEQGTVIDAVSGGNNGYEYGNQVISQVPSGYGLEAMDLCDSIFGYWPCPAGFYARRPNDYGCCHEGGGHGYERSGAADYLFGSSDPYVERRDGGGSFGQPIHCYERRYQEQPLYGQVWYDHGEYSSSQNYKLF